MTALHWQLQKRDFPHRRGAGVPRVATRHRSTMDDVLEKYKPSSDRVYHELRWR